MKSTIVERATKNKLQAFVHGCQVIIYADTEKNIIIVSSPEFISQINLTPAFTEKMILNLMKIIYTEIINENSSN